MKEYNRTKLVALLRLRRVRIASIHLLDALSPPRVPPLILRDFVFQLPPLPSGIPWHVGESVCRSQSQRPLNGLHVLQFASRSFEGLQLVHPGFEPLLCVRSFFSKKCQIQDARRSHMRKKVVDKLRAGEGP